MLVFSDNKSWASVYGFAVLFLQMFILGLIAWDLLKDIDGKRQGEVPEKIFFNVPTNVDIISSGRGLLRHDVRSPFSTIRNMKRTRRSSTKQSKRIKKLGGEAERCTGYTLGRCYPVLPKGSY